MSEASTRHLKVSREGIVLIKSFEGFRPRAIQRADGGWLIGYGHTLSAREGASVSEADAELLLRYDLLPVEQSVNDAVMGPLNQHQFDALVSFAFSVGIDDFAASDVRQRLSAGAPDLAADAILGWPEPALPETALRRRAAERALFVANPEAPVALSDLLSAPLPPPAVPALIETAPIEPVTVEPVTVAETPIETPTVEETQVVETPTEETPVQPVVEIPVFGTPVAKADPLPVEEEALSALTDPREAAVAALLGEPAARIVMDEAPQEAAQTAPAHEVEAAPTPSNDNPPADAPAEEEAQEISTTEPVAELEPQSPETVEETPVVADDTPVAEPASEEPAPEEPTTEEATTEDATPVLVSTTAPAESDAIPSLPPSLTPWASTRYAPYSSIMVGPLPYLEPAAPVREAVTPNTPAIDHSVVEVAAPEAHDVQTVDPEPAPVEAAIIPFAPVDPAPVAELVLTPPEDAPEPAIARPLWTPVERDEPDGSENNLFGEELTLTQGGGPIMRHEFETEAPARFDWSETGPFIFMGGVGLVSFGASMAAFRRAAEQSGGSDLTIIGWVLALIGLACVGVSSVNLYRKFGLPGGD